jgi:sigma-E factor negative regulatory protein RseA
MTEGNREKISCLVDGELERSGCDFLVRRMASDEELTCYWRRYHVIRACMQREFSGNLGLAERVAALVDNETPVTTAAKSRVWLRPLAGAAIAASVAVVALIGMNSSVLEQNHSQEAVSQSGFVSRSNPLDRPFNQPLVPVSLSEPSPADRQRINSYLLRHTQAAGGAGFTSYVPIVVSARRVTPDESQQQGSVQPAVVEER